MGATRVGAYIADDLLVAEMDIKDKLNPSNIYIWTNPDTKYIGAIPESSGSATDYALARCVVSYGILGLRSFPVSFAWLTSQMIFNMLSKYDGIVNNTTEQKRTWDYTGGVSDAGQYFYFLTDVSPYNQASFTFSYKIIFAEYGQIVREVFIGPYEVILPAQGPGQGFKGESWNPGMMTDAEKEKYGIEEIPIEWLKEGIGIPNISPETLQELLDSGETVVYYAHNLPVVVRPCENCGDSNSETTTPTLILPSVTATPASVPTVGTALSPTPTPLHTPEPAKEPDQILVPAVTPTPTRAPSSRYNN